MGSPGSWAQTSPEEALKSIQALKGRQDFQDPRLGRGRDSEGHEGNQQAGEQCRLSRPEAQAALQEMQWGHPRPRKE